MSELSLRHPGVRWKCAMMNMLGFSGWAKGRWRSRGKCLLHVAQLNARGLCPCNSRLDLIALTFKRLPIIHRYILEPFKYLSLKIINSHLGLYQTTKVCRKAGFSPDCRVEDLAIFQWSLLEEMVESSSVSTALLSRWFERRFRGDRV